MFLALVIIVLFISKGGFFAQFNRQAFGQSSAAAVGGPVSVPISMMGSLAT
jgi:hypothetical protein